MAGDQHHDLAGQRHADGQEHRLLRANSGAPTDQTCSADNWLIPTGTPLRHGTSIRCRLHPRRIRAVIGLNNATRSTLTEELQFQGTAADGRLVWQAGAYLEISKPLTFSSGTETSILHDLLDICDVRLPCNQLRARGTGTSSPCRPRNTRSTTSGSMPRRPTI